MLKNRGKKARDRKRLMLVELKLNRPEVIGRFFGPVTFIKDRSSRVSKTEMIFLGLLNFQVRQGFPSCFPKSVILTSYFYHILLLMNHFYKKLKNHYQLN